MSCAGKSLEAYLLAAGRSERIGASKPLLPFGERTVLARMADAFRGAGAEDLRVVGRPDDAELAREADALGLAYLENANPERGMAGSILVALEHCASDWLAVCPADMPLLRTETVAACCAALGCEEEAVQPACDGRTRHPVFLRSTLRQALQALLTTGGRLRDFLPGVQVREVPVSPCSQFEDFDTPEEYRALLRVAGLESTG